MEAGLGEGVATLLKMVTGGVIRVEGAKESRPVAFHVPNDGRLYEYWSYDRADASYWSLGRATSVAE